MYVADMRSCVCERNLTMKKIDRQVLKGAISRKLFVLTRCCCQKLDNSLVRDLDAPHGIVYLSRQKQQVSPALQFIPDRKENKYTHARGELCFVRGVGYEDWSL